MLWPGIIYDIYFRLHVNFIQRLEKNLVIWHDLLHNQANEYKWGWDGVSLENKRKDFFLFHFLCCPLVWPTDRWPLPLPLPLSPSVLSNWPTFPRCQPVVTLPSEPTLLVLVRQWPVLVYVKQQGFTLGLPFCWVDDVWTDWPFVIRHDMGWPSYSILISVLLTSISSLICTCMRLLKSLLRTSLILAKPAGWEALLSIFHTMFFWIMCGRVGRCSW